MIKDFIDMHVHVGPEPVPRRYTAESLLKKEGGKLAGMVLKNHFYPTMPLIRSARAKSRTKLYGSIVLNNYVGGLNPDVIYASARLSDAPIVVWFPTISAQRFLNESKYEIPSKWFGKTRPSGQRLSSQIKGIRVVENGRVTDAAKRVIEAILDNGSVLATGHISWQESKALVSEALSIGIKKIVITHPIYQPIAMPLDVLKELTSNKEVFAEQTYSMYSIDQIAMSDIAAQIKSIGPKRCIICSDSGQVGMASPSEALESLARMLKAEGVSEDDLRRMGSENPRYLLR